MKSKKKPIILIVFGSFFTLGPVWGLLGTIVGMVQSFQAIDQNGTTNPEALSSNIGFALQKTVIGIMMLPIGLILLTLGIIWLIKIHKHNNSLIENVT